MTQDIFTHYTAFSHTGTGKNSAGTHYVVCFADRSLSIKISPAVRQGIFCEDRTIEMFLRFRCLDLNTRHNHSASLRFCFQGFYSTISISVPPIKTTLIFSFDSTTTHSMICLTSLSSYSIGWFCSPSSMVKISSSRDLALSLF